MCLEVACSIGGAEPTVHQVQVHRDWSVETGHDLTSERVAAGLGGRLSCLDLVDRTIPVVRAATQLWTRAELPRITRTSSGWEMTDGCRCRRTMAFRDPRSAAAHARSAEHLAVLHQVDYGELTGFLDTVSTAYGDLQQVPDHPARRVVAEPTGLDDLWTAGIAPERVSRLHAQVWPDGPALPYRLYLHALVLGADLDYLRSIVDASADPDVLTWAAMSETQLDRRHPRARAQWIVAGASRRDVLELVESGYTADTAHQVAAATGDGAAAVSRILAAWARTGCSPDSRDLTELREARRNRGWYVPGKGSIDALMTACLQDQVHPTRTQAALVLAVTGDLRTALTMIKAGVRSPGSANPLSS